MFLRCSHDTCQLKESYHGSYCFGWTCFPSGFLNRPVSWEGEPSEHKAWPYGTSTLWPNKQQISWQQKHLLGEVWCTGQFKGLGVKNTDFRTQLNHWANQEIHLEKVPGPLWASVWAPWASATQLSLQEKTSCEHLSSSWHLQLQHRQDPSRLSCQDHSRGIEQSLAWLA